MKLQPLDPHRARTRKLATLSRLVRRDSFASEVAAGASLRDFLDSLPEVLGAAQLRQLARAIAEANRGKRAVLLMSGAHPIKVGLGPIICGLLRDGIIDAIATNGAAIIHDFELACAGRTSEDVGAGLSEGIFGMAEETGAFLNRAAKLAASESKGLGEIVGREILEAKLKFREQSVFATAYQIGAPATVHVTLGADIIHMHPGADGAAIGAATMADFHRLGAVVAELTRGVVINLGSAVVMPEVFLKALNLARNLGRKVSNFTAADMDFIRHYRPQNNVVERPTENVGRRIILTGHHEVMFPLLAAAVREELANPTSKSHFKIAHQETLMPSRSPRRKSSSRTNSAPIAILTDFGYRDHYTGVMKGIIATIAPTARIIDITHGISPQSVSAGALALAQSWRFFPPRTIFLAVVDPGVGTSRLPIAVETGSGARFVGPDNGLLYLAAKDAGIGRIVELRAAKYRLKNVSSTFHGRDIFAPAAASLWSGTPMTSLGPTIAEMKQLSIAPAVQRGNTLEGAVIYVDGYGNLVTNIDRATLEAFAASFRAVKLLVRIVKGASMEIFQAYGDVPSGAPLATFGSSDLLEIAIRDGNAASHFELGEGAPVMVIVST
jgi:S-adenosylmethionine hydrolase/deoxyhypusine synthase